MKKYIFILSTFFIILNCSALLSWGLPENQRLAYETLGSITKKFKKKYGFKSSGTGIAMPNGIEEFTWFFSVNQPLTEDEGRELLCDCIEEILMDINTNYKLRQYLIHYPFTSNDIFLCLSVKNNDSSIVLYPEISSISLVNGKLRFKSHNLENRYNYITCKIESFEEAKSICKSKGKTYED